MTLTPHSHINQWLRHAVYILSLCLLFPYYSYSSDLAQQTPVTFHILDKKAANALSYQSMMFDYYSGHYFKAATQILAREKMGGYGPARPHSQYLLSQLYLDIGMSSNAEQQLAKIPSASHLHHQFRLSLAELYYQQSSMDNMHRLLSTSSINFTAPQANKRNYLLGLYYLDADNPLLAIDHLIKVSKTSEFYPFARLNTAIAFIQNKQITSATKQLQALLDRKASGDEALIFRDRVALTLGEIHLKSHQIKKSQAAFREVRLNSPYAAPALLGLGWTHRLNKNHKAALAPWLKLQEINAPDPIILQNLLLIPRHYENLGASKKAFVAYNHARAAYIRELNEIKKARQAIQNQNWLKHLLQSSSLKTLNPSLIRTDDLNKQLAEHDIILNSIGADRLFQRYASNAFSRRFKQYIQLEAFGNYLSLWQEQLPIYSEMIQDYQIKQDVLSQRVNQTLAALDKLSHDHATDALKKGSPETDLQWLSLMTREERHMLVLLNNIKIKLQSTPSSTLSAQQKENLSARASLLKGSLNWKISRDAPSRREKLRRAKLKLEIEKQQLHENKKSILSAQQMMQRKLEPFQIHIHHLHQRLQQTQHNIKSVNLRQHQFLQHIALQTLDQQEKQLGHFLAIAELSIARMHENATFQTRHKQ